MRRRFATLDVFTDRRFAGNPLAVVMEAEGLETDVMQAIAREFNHPETVFVFAPTDPAHRARLRIFTPARELPFAGHPTVGTAVLLALCDRVAAGSDLVLEEGLGAVRCTVESVDSAGGAARFAIPKLPYEVGPAADTAAIAAALSLDPSDIEGRPARGSAGIPFTFVAIRSLGAMARCRPDAAKFDAAFPDGAAYVFCSETAEPGHHFHARMFAPGMGVAEDPATGSAAAAFAGLLASRLGDGEHTVAIEQGYEMGRPSVIRLAFVVPVGRGLRSVSVGGDAVVVTEGTIEA
jgi:trans-2,3-dihydro-3-hydroxyanthranilate isomerase